MSFRTFIAIIAGLLGAIGERPQRRRDPGGRQNAQQVPKERHGGAVVEPQLVLAPVFDIEQIVRLSHNQVMMPRVVRSKALFLVIPGDSRLQWCEQSANWFHSNALRHERPAEPYL